MSREPIWELVEESLDEAEFLWGRWETELSSLTRNLDEIFNWTEDRLQGALAGVRVGGEATVEKFLIPALAGESLKRITVSAHLLAAGLGPRAITALGEVLASADGARLDALLRGIETAALDGTFVPVANKLAQGDAARAAALCRLKSFRRSAVGAELAVALRAENPAVRAGALRAARFAGEEASRHIEEAYAHEDPAVACAAIETGLRRQLPAAWNAARERARVATPGSAALLRWTAALGAGEEFRVLGAAVTQEPLRREALYALGHVGTAEAIEICLAHLDDPLAARAAGEAYCAITGAELERDKLDAPEPEADTPSFEDDNLDANLVPASQDLWPLPNPDAVRRHWQGIKARYEPGTRYLLGQPRNSQTLVRAIETAPMLRRPDWVFELNVRTQGQFDLETRAFRVTQMRQQLAARTLLGAA
jgi:uncharacterized protein (TIGR02270 family)